MKYYINLFIEKMSILIWKLKNKKDYSTLDTLKNDLKELKGVRSMGYEKIKELISDINAYHNEAQLRELLQQIYFICEENINEPSNSDQTENR